MEKENLVEKVKALQTELESTQTHARNHIMRFKADATALRTRLTVTENALPGILDDARLDLLKNVDILRGCDVKTYEQITNCINVRLLSTLMKSLTDTSSIPSSSQAVPVTTPVPVTATVQASPSITTQISTPVIDASNIIKPTRRKFRPQIFADVDDVTVGAPAFEAGLRVEDRLLSVGGVTSIDEVKHIARANPGKPLRVVLLRGKVDNPLTVELTLIPGKNGFLGCVLSLPLHLRPGYESSSTQNITSSESSSLPSSTITDKSYTQSTNRLPVPIANVPVSVPASIQIPVAVTVPTPITSGPSPGNPFSTNAVSSVVFTSAPPAVIVPSAPHSGVSVINPSNPFGPGFQTTSVTSLQSSPPKQVLSPGNPFATSSSLSSLSSSFISPSNPISAPVPVPSPTSTNPFGTKTSTVDNSLSTAPRDLRTMSIDSPSVVTSSPTSTRDILEEANAYPSAHTSSAEEDEYSTLGAGAISRLLKEWGVSYDRREVVEKADLLDLLRKHAKTRTSSSTNPVKVNNEETGTSTIQVEIEIETLERNLQFKDDLERQKKIEVEKALEKKRQEEIIERETLRKKIAEEELAIKEEIAKRKEEEELEKKRLEDVAIAAAQQEERLRRLKEEQEEHARVQERIVKEAEIEAEKARLIQEEIIAQQLLEEQQQQQQQQQQKAAALEEEEKARAEALAKSKAEAAKLKAEAAAAREHAASQQRIKDAAAAAAAERARVAKEAAAAAEAEAASLAAAAAQAEYEASLPLAEGWCEAFDAEGKVYYFHEKSRISRWTRPVGDAAAAISQRLIEQEAEAQRRHAERLADIQQREADAASERAQSDSIKVKIRALIDKWATKAGWLGLKVVRRSIRASANHIKAIECVSLVPRRCMISLLATLHEVVPSLTGDSVILDKPSSNQLVDDSILATRPDYYVNDSNALTNATAASLAISDGVLRRSFLNALRMLHPDKTSDESLETRLTAEMLYTTLTEVNGAMQDAKSGSLLATGGIVGETEL